MRLHGIDFPEDRIADFCRKHGVSRLSLFGSIVRDDFNGSSDIDVLIEFLPGKGPSLLGFAGIQIELGELLSRSVHLHTPSMLSPFLRSRIMRDARVQYAA